MGQGEGKDYKPRMIVREVGSIGTSVILPDYKTGRSVHLFSQGEKHVWYLLRWIDDVIEIREQYPLSLGDTLAIAKEYGLNHPRDSKGYITMTTDLYVITNKGDLAVSVKANDDPEGWNVKNLFIEKEYWTRKNIKWVQLYSDKINTVKALNIMDVTRNYNESYFPDKINFVKYLIGHKYITVDMDTKLDYQKIMKEKEKEIDIWLTELLKLENR